MPTGKEFALRSTSLRPPTNTGTTPAMTGLPPTEEVRRRIPRLPTSALGPSIDHAPRHDAPATLRLRIVVYQPTGHLVVLISFAMPGV